MAVALWLGGCGGDRGGGASRGATSAGPGGEGSAITGEGAGSPGNGGDSGRGPAGTTVAAPSDRTGIEAAVHRYVDALNAGDGAALCSLLAPGALDGVQIPVRRRSCAASLTASVGHPSPKGSPRWLRTKLVDADTVVTIEGGGLARFTGTVVHRFAGSREPSIEDDVVYLRRAGEHWLIAKPSATFYRAIGAREVPITALTPP